MGTRSAIIAQKGELANLGNVLFNNYCEKFNLEAAKYASMFNGIGAELRARLEDGVAGSGYATVYLEAVLGSSYSVGLQSYSVYLRVSRNGGWNAERIEELEIKAGNNTPAEIQEKLFSRLNPLGRGGLKTLSRFTRDWDRATFGDICDRLGNTDLILYQPWGFTYSGNTTINEQSKRVLELDALMIMALRAKGYNVKLIIMFADTYAGKINGWLSSSVQSYWENLRKAAKTVLADTTYKVGLLDFQGFESDKTLQKAFIFKQWSGIIDENREAYQAAKEKVLARDEELEPYIQEATSSALKYSKRDPSRSAKEYVLERMMEGELVENLYKPIKISLSTPSKDYLDGVLPRVYLKWASAFPWLAPDTSGDRMKGMLRTQKSLSKEERCAVGGEVRSKEVTREEFTICGITFAQMNLEGREKIGVLPEAQEIAELTNEYQKSMEEATKRGRPAISKDILKLSAEDTIRLGQALFEKKGYGCAVLEDKSPYSTEEWPIFRYIIGGMGSRGAYVYDTKPEPGPLRWVAFVKAENDTPKKPGTLDAAEQKAEELLKELADNEKKNLDVSRELRAKGTFPVGEDGRFIVSDDELKALVGWRKGWAQWD